MDPDPHSDSSFEGVTHSRERAGTESRKHRTPMPTTRIHPPAGDDGAFMQGAMAAHLQGLSEGLERLENGQARLGSKFEKASTQTATQYQEILRRFDAGTNRMDQLAGLIAGLEKRMDGHEEAHNKTRGHVLDVVKPLVTQALWAAAAFFAAMWASSARQPDLTSQAQHAPQNQTKSGP